MSIMILFLNIKYYMINEAFLQSSTLEPVDFILVLKVYD